MSHAVAALLVVGAVVALAAAVAVPLIAHRVQRRVCTTAAAVTEGDR